MTTIDSATDSVTGSSSTVIDNMSKAEITFMMQSMQASINELKAAQSISEAKGKLKSGKLDKYKGGSKGPYQTLIKECEKRFENASFQPDQEKINGALTYVKSTPDQI